MADLVKTTETSGLIPFKEVEDKIVIIRGQEVLLDRDVAELYGVQTREVNQAVRNNPQKFPKGYVVELTNEESTLLRSKLLTLEKTAGKGRHSKYNYKAFTEKGLYMLATVLKSPKATAATLAIIETFTKVRELKRELLDLHKETDDECMNRAFEHLPSYILHLTMPSTCPLLSLFTSDITFPMVF